jgi:hypothetical protein
MQGTDRTGPVRALLFRVNGWRNVCATSFCQTKTEQLMSGSSSGELLLFPIPAMTAIPLRPFVSFGS